MFLFFTTHYSSLPENVVSGNWATRLGREPGQFILDSWGGKRNLDERNPGGPKGSPLPPTLIHRLPENVGGGGLAI